MFLAVGFLRFFLILTLVFTMYLLSGGLVRIFFQPTYFFMTSGIYIASYFSIMGWNFPSYEVNCERLRAAAHAGLIISISSLAITGGMLASSMEDEHFISSIYSLSIGLYYSVLIYYCFFVPYFTPNDKSRNISNTENLKSREKMELYLSRSLMVTGAVTVALFGVAGVAVLFDTKSSNPEVQAMYEDIDRRMASEVAGYVSKNCKEMDWEIEQERRNEIEKEERMRRGLNDN